MLRFRTSSPLPGWVACVPQGGHASLALVERHAEAAPSVRWVAREGWTHAGSTLRGLKRSRALARHRRVVLLPREHYRLSTLDAPPDMPRAEWAAAVRWQLRDTVDFPVEAAAVDVLAIPDGASYRAQAQLIAVAAPETAVRPLVEEAHGAGLPWQAIDIAETALRNLSALVETPDRAQALLHCEEAYATLVVTYQGELLATRHFEQTLDALTQRDEGGRQRALDQIGLELQRTLDGIERSFGQVALARLLVTPMPGQQALCEHLAPLLYVPVAAYDLSALDLQAVPELLAEPALLNQHLCAIGAGLRED